ncbi:unnamed protein product [Lepidochelys olivacea]
MGPPRYWRPWVGKTLVIINWVTLLFFVLVFPNCAYREHNSFVLLAHHVATLTNQTDCWVCAPTPLSPKTGMPLDMLPLTLAELATTKEQERTDSPFWNKTSLQQATYQDQEYSVAVLSEGVLCFTRNQSDPYGHPVGKSSCVITQWADGYWIKTNRGGQRCGCNGSSPFRETLTNNLTTKKGFGNVTCRPVNISNVASQWWVCSGPYGECNLNGTIRNAPTCTQSGGWDAPLGAYELFGKAALNIPGIPLRNSPSWALQGHYFVCGRKAYKVLPANWTGSCYIAHGVPHLSITATLPKGKIRNARDTSVESREKTLRRLTKALAGNMKNPLTTEKLVGCSVLGIAPLFTGPALACIGRYTVRLQMVLEKVALELEDSVSDLGSAVKTLNEEVQQLRTFSLQNRLALDYLLASQGGVCALIGPRCCVYVNDSSYEIYEKVVQAEAHARAGAQVAYTAPENDWLQTLFSGWGLSSWLGGLFSLLLKLLFPVLLVLLVLCCAVSCVRALLQKLISHSLQGYHKVLMQSPIVKK